MTVRSVVGERKLQLFIHIFADSDDLYPSLFKKGKSYLF